MFGQQLKITFRKPLGLPLKKPTPLFLLTPTPLPPAERGEEHYAKSCELTSTM